MPNRSMEKIGKATERSKIFIQLYNMGWLLKNGSMLISYFFGGKVDTKCRNYKAKIERFSEIIAIFF